MEQPKYLVLDARQTVMQSVVSDGVTFALLLLCIWTSLGSKWWTFFTTLMFIAYLGGKCANAVGSRRHKFKNIEDLQNWIDQERSNNQAQPDRPEGTGSAGARS